MNIFYIYIYLNPLKPGKYVYNGINFGFRFEPFYIGKGCINNCKERCYSHLSFSSLKDNSYKSNKINKILKELKLSKEEYRKYIIKIETELDENLAFAKEMFYIDKIGRKDLNKGPLVNKTDGGEGRSNYIMTDETKQILSKLNSGKNNPNFGLKRSEETKEKMRKNHANLSGKNHPFYGKYRSDEVKQKIRQSTSGYKHYNSKVWFLIDPDKEIIGPIFDFKTFCKINNLNQGNMNQVALGKGKYEKTKSYKNWKVYKRYTKEEWELFSNDKNSIRILNE